MTKRLYAVLSDIHANYHALKLVEEDARRTADEEGTASPIYINLGDVVDYGPHPRECLHWVKKNARYNLMGNHDKALLRQEAEVIQEVLIQREFHPLSQWTLHQLSTDRWIVEHWQQQMLVSICPSDQLSVKLFHGSQNPQQSYHQLSDTADAMREFDFFRASGIWLGLFGHSHHQLCFQRVAEGKSVELSIAVRKTEENQSIDASQGFTPFDIDQWFNLNPGRQYLLGPGSCGQPRLSNYLIGVKGQDHIPHAAYLQIRVDEDLIRCDYRFRQLPYHLDELRHDMNSLCWPNLKKEALEVDFRLLMKEITMPVTARGLREILNERLKQQIREHQIPWLENGT